LGGEKNLPTKSPQESGRGKFFFLGFFRIPPLKNEDHTTPQASSRFGERIIQFLRAIIKLGKKASEKKRNVSRGDQDIVIDIPIGHAL